jgi:hypothetical protein
MPRLGKKYDVEIEVISKPRAEYRAPDYLKQELPAAPAIMVGDEIVVAGSDISEDELEAVICRHLGRPAPKPRKKGIMDRFFNR